MRRWSHEEVGGCEGVGEVELARGVAKCERVRVVVQQHKRKVEGPVKEELKRGHESVSEPGRGEALAREQEQQILKFSWLSGSLAQREKREEEEEEEEEREPECENKIVHKRAGGESREQEQEQQCIAYCKSFSHPIFPRFHLNSLLISATSPAQYPSLCHLLCLPLGKELLQAPRRLQNDQELQEIRVYSRILVVGCW